MNQVRGLREQALLVMSWNYHINFLRTSSLLCSDCWQTLVNAACKLRSQKAKLTIGSISQLLKMELVPQRREEIHLQRPLVTEDVRPSWLHQGIWSGLMFTRVQRGEECSYIKDIILCILSHQFFSFFMEYKVLEEKYSLSLEEGRSFDLEMCMSAPSWSLVFTPPFSLCPLRFL